MYKKIIKKVSFFLLFSIFLFSNGMQINASEGKYSFEKSEELMHKINWKKYSNETINLAKKENKPVFLLLSAPSWCYWCQVYESEEYLFNPKIVKYLNENFITIFVDADKRQDLTRKYLESGWPSTTVLAPNMERIFGFSGVRPIENMLENLERAKIFVEENSSKSTKNTKINYEKKAVVLPSKIQIKQFLDYYNLDIEKSFDKDFGGFGNGQKFPQARTLDYLIDEYNFSKNKFFLEILEKTLENHFTKISEIKTNYNLFDPIEGGFHRYGTTKNWSPPHYEKMLYDNAKLLKVYFKLGKIKKDNPQIKEIIGKTLVFFNNYFIDKKNGGFFSDTSAYLEEEYYGLKNREKHPKPRVETTKYTDWNSEAIITFLFLYEQTGDEKFKKIAENSLDFFEKNMIGKNGVLHFFKNKNEKGVSGNLLDNSYLLLAFTDAYEVFGEKKYLETAEKIAKYSLENLYDYNSGGFFERNSKEKNIYLKGEEIDLKKPFEENSLIAFSFLKLYENTENLEYLMAGTRTIGNIKNNFSGLDRGYFYVKSLKLLDKNLLNEYFQNGKIIEKINEKKLKTFWLNKLIFKQNNPEKKEIIFEEKKEIFNFNFYLFAIIAFIAGFLSFISPCTLPILPVFIANLLTSNKKNLFLKTFLFLIGLNLTFAFLGVLSGIFGNLINEYLGFISQISGILLIIFGFIILFGKGFKGINLPKFNFTNYFGSFLLGIFLAISWTPCDGPLLVSIMSLASTSGNISTSAFLLLFYGFGLSIPLLFVALFLNKSDKKSKILQFLKGKEIKIFKIKIHTNHLISGIIFIIIGYLIFSGGLIKINEIFSGFDLQKYLSGIEEFLMKHLKK